MKSKQRIFVVDDHPFIRKGLCETIAAEPDLDICGEAEGWREALEKVRDNPPDLIVLDLNLKDGNGWMLLEHLMSQGVSIPVLVLSVCDEEIYGERLLKAGARGYLMKDAPIQEVLTAIHKILSGYIALSEKMASRLIQNAVHPQRSAAAPMEQLSAREFQVYEMLGRGLSNKKIGENLGVSHKTVGTYKARLMEKLGDRTTPELMRHARQLLAMQDKPGQ